MFGVALSTTACLRAGTRVDIIWLIDGHGLAHVDPSDAMSFTPGGGRFGSLLGGALDGHLTELAARPSQAARVVEVEVTGVDAAAAGLSHGGPVRAVVAPATALPDRLWPLLLARQPVCLVAHLAGSDLIEFEAFTPDDAAADREIAAHFLRGLGGTTLEHDGSRTRLVSVFVPVDRLVVAGGGPIVDALCSAAALHEWHVQRAADVDTAQGLMVGLRAGDMVVVLGHDVELSSRMLAAALASDAGYIGALGSHKMQQQRADWLAYRSITDLDRVNGPAGLAIGATTPAEIAVSILAQIIAVRNL